MRAVELLVEAKSVHMQHAEDLLLDHGYEGAVSALNHFESVRQMLAKGKGHKGKVTVKWDGSPAVFAGIDPVDGKFFVGTKAVLSKNPKYIKSPADAKKYYSEQPELAKKLVAAYKFLRNLGITGILQGDLMFTEGDVKEETIDGEQYLTFTPNTITYAVPANSELAKAIRRAKIGVVFHTTHDTGSELLRDTAMSFGVDLSTLRQDPNVWMDDATYKDYTGIASLTPEEDAFIKKEIAVAQGRLKKLGKKGISTVLGNADFKSNIQPFINKRVRTGDHIGNTQDFVRDFIEYFAELKQQGIENLSPANQKKRLQKIADKKAFVKKNLVDIYSFIDLYNHLNEIKLALIKKLNALDSLKTFIKSEEGYQVTAPEGYVAIGHDGGAVKLVDRLEFTRQNFAKKRDV